jgi:hypothetical protein
MTIEVFLNRFYLGRIRLQYFPLHLHEWAISYISAPNKR